MKKLLLLLIIYASCLCALRAQQCSENTSVNGNAGTGFSNGTIGQSFTACKSGNLASVSVQAGNAGVGFNNVIVQIFSGDGFAGSVLATTGQVHVKANRTTTWGLTSHNIQVVEGQKYTARFLTQSGTPMMAYGTGANAAIDYYTRGRIYGVGQSHHDMFFSAVIETLSDPVKTPEDDAVDVTRDTEVKLSFSRAMEAVSGNITINNITDASSQTIDVTTLTINGTEVLMPMSIPLDGGKNFEIVIPSNTLRSTNQIPFPGLTSGEWTFTTSTKPFATLSTTSTDLTNDGAFPFTIDFSDVVTGFELTDFVITNGVASNLAGSGDSFTFDVTPSADGEVVVSLPADMVEAGASNGNDSTGYSLIYDGTVPSVELRTDVSGTIQTSIFDIEVVFSEPVTDFETSDLVIANADVISNTSTKDSLFTVSVRAQSEGQITVDLPASIANDLAGNTNTAAPAIIDVTFSVDLESDLFSYYPFNGNADDTVSTGFNGTVTGATLATGFDGAVDGSYSFDGSDQITFGDTPIGAGSFTLAFWVKIPEGLGQNQLRTILSKRAICGEGRFFEINYNNSSTNGHQISIEQRNNAGVSNPVANLSSVGGWTHIAYVKDNDQLQSSFYVNGVQQTPVGWTSTYNFENTASLKAGISTCDGTGRFKFNGEMDDLYVYGRALSAVEIDLLAPFTIQDVSVPSGSNIQAGQAIQLTFNKDLVQSSATTSSITAVGSISGSINNIGIASSQDNITINPPTTGWPIDEDVTISLSGLLAENGTTLPNTDLTYSVIADEAVGLILHYPISGNVNEAIGGIAGQDGTITGALFTEGPDGDPFGALSFDGADDFVTLGDAPISSESFSISMWLKVPIDGSTTQNTVVLSKRVSCTEGRMINIWYSRSGDKFKVVAGLRDNANAGSVGTGFDFPVNEWVKVTFVKDNSTKQNRLIVNDILATEGGWLLNSINVENSTSIKLGTSPCVGNGEVRFDGLIDDLRIYNRAIEPRIVSIEPIKGTVNAAVDTVVTISFDRAIDVSSLKASTVTLNDANGVSYPYTTTFSNGDSVLTITPDNLLPKGKTITVAIDTLSAQIGADFLPFKTSFTTVATKLLSHSPFNGVSNVDSIQTIAFKFDNIIDESSLELGIKVIGSHHGPVEGIFTMPATDSVVFTPSIPYFPNEMITVYVTKGLMDQGGEAIAIGKAFGFHVSSTQFVNPTLIFELSQLTTPISTSSPRDLVPADLDNDGDLDLVGGDENPGTLFWFENKGFGNFGDGQIIDSNNDYFDIEVTDFDFDGDLDLVTVSRLAGKGVYWYENDGSGAFTERTIIALSGSADLRAVTAADFNGDGSMDVVTVDFGLNRLTAYDKDGNSLFAAANVGGPLDVQAADREGDGDLDLYLGNYTNGNVASFANSGFATFGGSALHSASQVRAVIPIDFDKDGDIDIVYSAQSASQIGILENNGNFTYTNHQVGSVGGPHRIDVGDIEGDGDFDIIYTVAGGASEINFYYLENNGSFGLWVPKKLIDTETFSGTFSQTAKFADVDNDGDLDVLATDAGTGFYIFENKIIDLNNGPQLENAIADQSMVEDSATGLTIDVSNVFIDAEGDAFTLTATADDLAVTATLNGSDLDITAEADFFGTVNITLTADDGNGVNNDVFALDVTSVNDAPAFNLSVASVTLDEDFTTTETITITQNQPSNEDAPSYSITPTSSFANVTIEANTGEITITTMQDAFGTQEFTVTADDGSTENNTAVQTFTLTVNAVNDLPEVTNAIADIAFDEDPANNQTVDITNVFSDVEDTNLTLSLAVLSGSDLAGITLTNGIIDIAPVADAFGTVQIEVTAEDASAASVADIFDIVINPINDAPTFTTSGDISVTKNFTITETVTMTADPAPFGEESQVITYSLSPANVNFSNVSIDQSTGEVSITAVADLFGTQEFTVTADDGQTANNIVIQTFTLTVVDQIPQSATFIGVADKTFGDADFSIEVSLNSGLPANFTVVSGGLSITESGVGNNGGGSATLSITGAGTATIDVTNDGDATYAPLQESIVIEIAKADQVITVDEISNKSVVVQPFNVVASVNTNLTLDYTISGPATISQNVVTLDGTPGTVEVTVSQTGTDDYNSVSSTISFEVVAQQSQSITFTDIPDLIYGATDQTLSASASSGLAVNFSLISGPGALTGNTLAVTGAGTIVIEANQSGDDDYLAAVAIQQSIIVAKAPLTVTADDQTITFGDAIPVLTINYNGFVSGEDNSVLSSAPVASTTATESSNTGSYDIAISGGTADNYAFTLVNGTLTIDKAIAEIIITDLEQTEDETPKSPTVTTNPVDLAYTITYNGNSDAPSAVGTYQVVVTIDDQNYSGSEEVTFNINAILSIDDEVGVSTNIYPNPVADMLIIESQQALAGKVVLINIKGVKVIEQDLQPSQNKVNVSTLPRGLYILIIQDENTAIVKRQKLLINR